MCSAGMTTTRIFMTYWNRKAKNYRKIWTGICYVDWAMVNCSIVLPFNQRWSHFSCNCSWSSLIQFKHTFYNWNFSWSCVQATKCTPVIDYHACSNNFWASIDSSSLKCRSKQKIKKLVWVTHSNVSPYVTLIKIMFLKGTIMPKTRQEFELLQDTHNKRNLK